MSLYKRLCREHHERTYGKPMCHLCDECYFAKSKKGNWWTYYCKLTGNDVGQSHFGLNSPRNCPKRVQKTMNSGA